MSQRNHRASKPEQAARALAKALGASIHQAPAGCGGTDIDIEAPDGKRWKGPEVHSVVGVSYTSDGIHGAWCALLRDLEDGLEECPADCECKS